MQSDSSAYQMRSHCGDVKSDRARGEEAERAFMAYCMRHERIAYPLQIGRSKSAALMIGDDRVIAPDVAVWGNRGCGSMHEIKRKYPTYNGKIGLEAYRLKSLAKVDEHVATYYTILLHDDTEKAQRYLTRTQKKYGERYKCGAWITARVRDLHPPPETRKGYSYVAGKKEEVSIHYWPVNNFDVLP